MTYALVFGDLAAFWSARDVMCDVLLGLHSTRVSARAGRTPSMGMCAGSMHTRGGGFCSCSSSNLPITTCWLLGAMVMLSLAFNSQALTGLEVLSQWELVGTCLSGELRAVSLFTLHKDRECSACIERRAIRSGHFPNVRK